MQTDHDLADFWTDVLQTWCEYPAPRRLASQLGAATITRRCDCGCNSFELTVRDGADPEPLAVPGSGGMIFEASFELDDGRQLDVLLFCGPAGNLSEIEVQCQGNSEPVPLNPRFDDRPFRVHVSDKVLAD